MVDFATYNPLSLALKEKGYLEEQLKSRGIHVKWLKSEGGNQAMENMYSGALNIGSTAASASLTGHMRGIRILAVGVASASTVPQDQVGLRVWQTADRWVSKCFSNHMNLKFKFQNAKALWPSQLVPYWFLCV